MTYLVDANVLSEASKSTQHARVVEWMATHEQELVVDSIIVGEILAGILYLPRGRKRAKLEEWFESVVETIECLPWTSSIARRWARLVAELRTKGLAMPALDGMIAATALEHDLTVATRNTRDFRKAGVRVFDPFQ
jgi:predicted nucleic acid-binding protein